MENGDDSEFDGEELLKLSHEAKLKELLRNLNSDEVNLCSNVSKEFIKLLRGHAGGELLRIYVQSSSKLSELLQAWNFQLGKPGLSYVLKLVSTILSHPVGIHNLNDAEGVAISRALDKFARSIFEEKLGDLYKELNSKGAKRQNAALLLLASIVRRGSGLASDVAKSFDFKLPIFPKLAEYKQKKISTKKKHSTRRAFVGFAMSFLEVGKPGLLRWVLQQKEMYSGALRGIGSDDDETVVFVLSTLRDRILIPESLVPPSLRSVLFGSVTLEQLVNICGREDGRVAAELAHRVLVIACTDPSNGLMPDLNRHPNPLKGNLKRLLDLMKKLEATEVDYHRDLLLAIVKGRPLFGSAYMDEFPYNVEDNASPNWFAAVSLAANLVSSVGSGLAFDFKPEDPPSFTNPDVQSLIKCICPRPFTRVIVNKGLLHTNSFVKHGTLRLVLEELKLFESFITIVESNFCSSYQMRCKWASLKQDIQNDVRIFLPDTQVLLSLLSSLSAHSKSLESSLKRAEDAKISLEQGVHAVKRLKTDTHKADLDILVSGVSYLPEITLQRNTGVVQGIHDVDDLNDGDDNAVIADIWGLRQCSESCMTIKDEETHFYSRLLDALKIYHRTMPALDGSFDFFKFLPSNPLALPTILQQSLLSLLLELIGWSPKSKIPVRIPPLMYKHLQPFVNLLLYSPIRDIKDQAHILAQAAMVSTGAFDKNRREIGVWFSFLPGYKIDGNFVGDQGIEEFQNLFSVIVSFLCDAVSTVGNNILKYWDVLRGHTCHLKGVEDVSPEFGPLFICVLEKCLRVLSSESGTFTVPEKSMIALYVCNTIKYLLQTQVETRLLYSLVDLLLSERVEVEDRCSLDDGDAQDLCEWRPLKNLFLFSRHIQNLEKKNSPKERKVLHADSSFANILGEVIRIVRSGSESELVCISKEFVLSILSTPSTVILRHFPSVISALKNLSGFPFSVLLSIFFLEPDLLYEVSKLWPEMFCNDLERFMGMVHGKEPIIGDTNVDAIESSSAAFCFFFKQAPFYVLFPASVRIDGLYILEGLNFQYLLQAKFSEVANCDFVSAVLLVLFWLHQIRLSHRIEPLAEFEQLSGTCSILIEKMLAHLQDSPIQSIFEVTEVILCHPVVMMSLQYPLGHKELTEGIFGESSEDFFVLARQGIHKMDHLVLNLLTSVCKRLATCCNGQNSVTGVDYLNQRFLSSFKVLVKRLNRVFRDRFEECIKTGDLRPLTPTLYALHSLIHFISPLELLELVLWIFSRIDLSGFTLRVSSDFSLLVGLSIAGCAFDMLSTCLQQPYTQGISSNIFWEMEDKPFDVLLFERVYFQVIKLAMRFELDAADRCLLKAVNVANIRKVTQTQWLPLTMDLSRVVHNTPIEVLSHFVHKTSMTRANMMFLLTELSPIHLAVFGHFFSDVMNEYLLPKDDVRNGTCSSMLSDDNFVMLLPTVLSYLISASLKYGEQFHKYVRRISSFYSRILFRSFSGWKSYATMDIFNIECIEFLPPSVEELLNLLSHSLLGKSILMLRYDLTLNGGAVKLKKRLKLFNSICPRSGAANEDLLDCDVGEIDAYSLKQSLNLANRVVAKIYLCRMLLLPKDYQIRSLPKEDGNAKEIHSEVGSNKEESARVRFMNLLLNTWHIIVKKFPSNSDDPQKLRGKYYFLLRLLEVFVSRNILEFTREMCDCPFIEQLARLSLLHRFGDPSTMKMLRGVLTSLSNGNSHILVLQLLLAHSQFAPSILSSSQASGVSQFGMIFRPMASLLRLLVIPSSDQNALYRENRQQKTSEIYMKQFEVLRLLRSLFLINAQQCSFDFGKDISANPRELLFLLLSSYGATLSEVDLEIYNLMLEIESANLSNSGSIAEMDYLWGSAAIRIRKEREQEQNLSSDMMQDVEAVEECRRTQFRENLHIDPKMCAYTVLYFPYGRTVFEVQPGNSDDMNETNCPGVEKIKTYDPVFILRFSIHSLSMGYIEPVEFASLGLLAVAFVSISSPHDEMRKLGYEALGGFKTALEKCQKRKDLMRLRLLLTYLQNGIEEPWQRIPSITAKFVAEASVILLDPLHNHYSTISKFLMSSTRVNMKSVPLFANFLWSSSVNFKTDRIWMLRLLYAGLDSDDDAQIYIRNNILEILLFFYASPLSDIESKELTLQVVKKSVKVHKMACHLVERCSIISWLSSIVSVFCGKQYQAETNLSRAPLNTVLEVVKDVISNRNIIEWLQQFALEQLSELSTHLYKLLVGGNLTDENVHLITSVLEILMSTLKISQERKVYQPHFTLSVEGLFKIYEVVSVCHDRNYSPCAELGLKAVLMSTPPGAILCMEQDKLLMFVRWATSTALQSSSIKELQPAEAYCHSTILLETEQSEDSLLSKLLRWLTASVILGRLSLRSVNLELNFDPEKSNLETLHSLLELDKKGCGESQFGFGCEEILAACIYGLQQLLGMGCRLLPSVVAALSLLLFSDLLNLAGSEMNSLLGNEKTLASLWSRVRWPVEANPSWRWSFYQPWKDLSSKSTDSATMDELHACESLLVIISNVIGKKSLHSQFLSHQDLEKSGVFNWERSFLESE